MDDKKRAQIAKIRGLAEAGRVEILAHFYQRREVRGAADFIGGSAELAARAFQSRAAAVMLCGPSYLTGEIQRRGGLSRPLLIPRADIACPLSDAVSLAEALTLRGLHPEALIVADIRAGRDIKEAADLEITPENARELLAQTGERPLIALPGPQLADQAGFGGRVLGRTAKAVCQVHELALPEELAEAQKTWPGALTAAHCLSRPDVLAKADFVGNASAIRDFCAQSPAREFIIVAETGLAEYLTETLPEKTFHETEAEIFCPNMKLTNLKAVIAGLEAFQQKQEELT